MSIKGISYKDESTRNMLVCNVILGDLCSYKCSYCNESSWGGKYKWIEYEYLTNFFDQMFEHYVFKLGKDEFVFEWLGGEPTVCPHLEDICKYVKDKGEIYGVRVDNKLVTNGYRKIKWWEDNIHLFDQVGISAHTEFCDGKHLKEVCEVALANGVFASVSLMMNPDKWDVCLNIVEELDKSKWLIPISPKILYKRWSDDFETRRETYDYTEEQKQFMKSFSKDRLARMKDKPAIKSRPVLTRRSSKVEWENGVVEPFDSGVMNNVKMGKNFFSGFMCRAGIDSVSISTDRKVHFGTGGCAVKMPGQYYFQLIEENEFVFPTEPLLCNQRRCPCDGDITTEKWKI